MMPVTTNSFAVTSEIFTEPPKVPPTVRFPPTVTSPANVPPPVKSAPPITPKPLPSADEVEPIPMKLLTLSSPPNVDTPVFLMKILLIPRELISSTVISGVPVNPCARPATPVISPITSPMNPPAAPTEPVNVPVPTTSTL